ncbi:MAG: ORF6N domain-containing protein [Clostridia bacterium]|nr:ORF6N domain-containing protein [Clostridia bacterium]
MQKLQVAEIEGKRVLTTSQLAKCYGTTRQVISNNYTRNRERYIAGKHFIPLEGQPLKDFNASHHIDDNLKFAHVIYLWTEKGALLHAKSLNTDKAWEVYDYLVDFYFRAKEKPVKQKKPEPKMPEVKRTSETRIPVMKNPISIFKTLLQLAHDKGIEVDSYNFEKVYSALYNRQIGIRTQLLLEQVNYELAYELSHALIHNDCGNLIESPIRKEYDIQAERAAEMIISLLNIQVA